MAEGRRGLALNGDEADRAVGRARDAEAALTVAEARIDDLTRRAERAEQRVADLEAQLNAIVAASTR